MSKKSILIVGNEGFLGRNLYEYFTKTDEYNVLGLSKKNDLYNFSREKYDYVIFAAGNSKTYMIKKDPVYCVHRDYIDLLRVLNTIETNKFIMFSSTLVYNTETNPKKEDSYIDSLELSLYGFHKLAMEKYVRELAERWLILRPAGFLGNYLKKNLLFDLRNNKTTIYYNEKSIFDYIHTDDFCQVLDYIKDYDNEIFNVGSGVQFSVNDILSLKLDKKQYRFASGHLVDDSKFSVKKIQNTTGLRFSRTQIDKQIGEFINGGNKS